MNVLHCREGSIGHAKRITPRNELKHLPALMRDDHKDQRANFKQSRASYIQSAGSSQASTVSIRVQGPCTPPPPLPFMRHQRGSDLYFIG